MPLSHLALYRQKGFNVTPYYWQFIAANILLLAAVIYICHRQHVHQPHPKLVVTALILLSITPVFQIVITAALLMWLLLTLFYVVIGSKPFG